MKTINVSDELHKKLSYLKLDKNLNDMGKVIEYLFNNQKN